MKEKLIPVIAQDAESGAVLMLAYANAEALARTRRTGRMHYWSRSRERLWMKGESSGHVQKVVNLAYDCDRDAILARVEQAGPACHRGTETCFGRAPKSPAAFFSRLDAVIRERGRLREGKKSYTARLLGDPALLRRKVLEEAAETVMASKTPGRRAVVSEAADLFYHLLVLLASRGAGLDDLGAELERRHGARR